MFHSPRCRYRRQSSRSAGSSNNSTILIWPLMGERVRRGRLQAAHLLLSWVTFTLSATGFVFRRGAAARRTGWKERGSPKHTSHGTKFGNYRRAREVPVGSRGNGSAGTAHAPEPAVAPCCVGRMKRALLSRLRLFFLFCLALLEWAFVVMGCVDVSSALAEL